MSQSQQGLELRKFFAPFDSRSDSIKGHGVNRSILDDGALDAYSELVLWRLHGVRAMVSLVDNKTQYFVAGVTRTEATTDEVVATHDWFGCSTLDMSGGLCENVVALNGRYDEYPCFQVPDLSGDPRFADLSIVNGTLASYRFYAGTPIITSHGINIGSFFIFDNMPRPEGLTLAQRKCLHQTAANIMKHLESKREAVERRRIALMSCGVSNFLERASQLDELESDSSNPAETPAVSSIDDAEMQDSTPDHTTMTSHSSSQDGVDEVWQGKKGASEIVLDKIKMTLDHAAEILRESLELTAGGVVFLDTAIGYAVPKNEDEYFDLKDDLEAIAEKTGRDERETSAAAEADLTMTGIDPKTAISPGQVRGYHDEYRPARILAISCSKNAYRRSKVLDGKTLQDFITVYPKGNVWYTDEKGYFSSLDQIEDIYNDRSRAGMYERRKSVEPSAIDITRQVTEAALLSKVFQNARQIIFLPLWDASADRWHSGCFVWSNHAFPVFTVETELSHVSSLTNSVMVQISRLDSITANNMKSDFISSISHEFRSPLHGILASAEFLHDSELDSTQGELVSTIQTCGSTLLDTINHVLDYSKINSFEKKSPSGALSNELDNISNVALICEDIVNGIMAAREFSSLADSTSLARHGSSQPHDPHPPHESSVEIILDFEKRDWNFKIQPGALRRIIMNIFGNAQKYTETGFILVQLRVKDAERRQANSSLKRGQKMLAMNIIDSGRGMSQQYMERKLYTPFAQEDSFAPGIGLGLSIVRSIVNQLGGKINIRSELGKGTDVEVLLPLEVPEPSAEAASASATATYAATSSDVEAAKAVETLRAMAHGKTMAVWRNEATLGDRNRNLSWKTVAAYCRTWFGFTILAGQEPATLAAADLVIKERVTADDDAEAEAAMALSIGEPSRVLILQEQLCRAGGRRGKLATSVSETISMPIGPFKLARCIMALFRERERSGTVGEEEPPSPTDKGQLDGAGSDGVAADEAPRTSSAETTDDVHCEIALPTPPSQDADADPFPTPPSQAADADPLPTPPSQAADADPLPTPPSQATDADTSPLPKRAGSTPFRPDAKKQASPSPSAPLSSPAPSPRPLRILAVDDNSLNLQLLTRYLGRRAQDRVVTARNGVEAVAAVRRGGGDGFDVVFMDISMPAMDGFEATRLIREFEREEEGRGKKGKSYVVALTGLASRRDRDEAVSSGFDEFLTKPIGFGMIGELLGRLSGRVG